MAKKNDFDLLDKEMEEDFHLMETEERVLKPHQFDSKFISESKAKKIEGLYMIPIEDIIPFQNKGTGDFSEWSDDDLKDLASTMDSEGSYEPILVRQMPVSTDGNTKFEVLAGEHRVKASKLKGLKQVKAIVFRACSDEKAMDIFLLTNLHRRKTKISDAIYGWSMFDKAHPRISTSEDLENAIVITEIANTDKLPINLSQYYRYVKMAKLKRELIDALDNQKISLRVGYELSRLTQDEQELFMPYLPYLSEANLQHLIREKNKNSFTITPEIIEEYILERKKNKNPYDSKLRKSMKKIRNEISENINPDYYDKIDQIFKDALAEYLNAHPEFKL